MFVLHTFSFYGILYVEDLCKENQHLKRTISKVEYIIVIVEIVGDITNELNLEASIKYPKKYNMNPPSTSKSKTHSLIFIKNLKSQSMQVPMELLEIKDDDINDIIYFYLHMPYHIQEHL